ncbi:MAG: GntR family transcriptional regulator [Cyanobacteria bacterium P01_D01_bin.123]
MGHPNLRIHHDSNIPASTQLLSQLRLAIASNQYPPGSRLPSTRQLALQTGLHRNTIGKVYAQLGTEGWIEARAGSGMYVRDRDWQAVPEPTLATTHHRAQQIVRQATDELIVLGYSLSQVRELWQTEWDWRSRCNALAIVCVPQSSWGTGESIVWELSRSLSVPLELVPLEQLQPVLVGNPSATVITSRYFAGQVEAITQALSARTIAVDIYDYQAELAAIGAVAPDGCIGLVCLSANIMQQAEVIVRSRYGDDLLVLKAHPQDLQQVRAMVRLAATVICDRASHAVVRAAVRESSADRAYCPNVVCCPNHVSEHSLERLRRELLHSRDRSSADDRERR